MKKNCVTVFNSDEEGLCNSDEEELCNGEELSVTVDNLISSYACPIKFSK